MGLFIIGMIELFNLNKFYCGVSFDLYIKISYNSNIFNYKIRGKCF